MIFQCWNPDHASTEEDAVGIEGYDAEDAAKGFAELWWSDSDHPETTTVFVRDGERVRVFEVEARQDVTFYASEVK